MKTIILHFIGFCCFYTTSFAQVNMVLEDIISRPGDTVSIPVTISADEAIHVLVYQFAIEWNSHQLTYLSTDNYFSSSLTSGNFGRKNSGSIQQQLITGWEDYPTAINITDTTMTLFHINFEVATILPDDGAIEVNLCADCVTEFHDNNLENLDLTVRGANVYMNGILPLDLLSFEAQNTEDEVILDWISTNETAHSHFEVEHSIDGQSWKKIGSVTKKENTKITNNYQFIHDNPSSDNNIYRLKIVDMSGAFTYSLVRMIRLSNRKNTISIENPIRHILTFQYTAFKDEQLQLKLYHLNGQLIKQVVYHLKTGKNTQEWNLSDIENGMYILNVVGREEQSYSIIIQ